MSRKAWDRNRNIRRNIMKKQPKNSTIKKLKCFALIALVLTSFTLFACGDSDDGPTNTAPTAADGTLMLNENTTVTGTLSATDSDGDTLTYSIVTNGTLGTAAITETATGAYTYTPNKDESGSDSFTFKANDGTTDSNVATITVTITVNNPPVANAGDDQTVYEQSVVSLSGTGTDIEDGSNVAYAWTQTGGPSVTLAGADTATPTFIGPAVSASTDLIFSLTVTDSEGATDTDDVTVTVINAGSLSASVDIQPDRVDLHVEGGLDWSHWGLADASSFNHKSGVTQQIGDYEQISPDSLTCYQNAERPTAFSWILGTPVAAATDSRTGLFFPTPEFEVGEGIRLTVPADTSEKTLKVYLGLFGAKVKFRAFLSDDSTPEVVEFIENSLSTETFRVVTLNFGAASDGQTLTIEYTLEQDIGIPNEANISLQAATLGSAIVATPTIDPPNGTFTDSVEVVLATATPSATIRYTTDGTDPNSSSTLYTGPFVRSDSVTVRARGFFSGFVDSAVATAQFTVNPSAGGSISASIDIQPDSVDLHAEGGLDWSHWGLADESSFNHKSGVTEQIGDYEQIIPGSFTCYQNAARPTAFSWILGTPVDEASDSRTGLFFPTPGLEVDEGIRLTVPADTSEKTLKVYLGLFGAKAKLRAFLSDDSASEVVEFIENSLSVEKFRVVTLNFGAGSDGQTLTIEYTLEQDIGVPNEANISLQAATLN
jgi:predicted outer membrane lipoprotein